jgi:hypothetical protein
VRETDDGEPVLVALWLMVIDPEASPMDEGANWTVTVRLCPGASEKESPPPGMEKPGPLVTRVPFRDAVELAEFEIMKLSSLDCPNATVPKEISARLRLISMTLAATPVKETDEGLSVLVAL